MVLKAYVVWVCLLRSIGYYLRHDTAPIPIEMHLRKASGSRHLESTPTTVICYVMCGGNLDGALENVCNTIKHVLIALKVLKAA